PCPTTSRPPVDHPLLECAGQLQHGSISLPCSAENLSGSQGPRPVYRRPAQSGRSLDESSTLYLLVGDVDSALQAAEGSRAAASTIAHPYYKAQLMLQLARLHQSPEDDTAEPLLEEA